MCEGDIMRSGSSFSRISYIAFSKFLYKRAAILLEKVWELLILYFVVDNRNEILKHFGFNKRKMQVSVNKKSNDF